MKHSEIVIMNKSNIFHESLKYLHLKAANLIRASIIKIVENR